MESIGRWLVGMGLVAIAVGGLLIVAGKLDLPLGRLPGDIAIERPGFRFYFPLGTAIVLSVVLSLVLWALSRWR